MLVMTCEVKKYLSNFKNIVMKLTYAFQINIVIHLSGRVLASSAGDPRFNPQSRTASYQRRYKNCL